MLDIYNKMIDEKEKKRIEKLQLFDEFEEWNLIMSHYFVGLAHNWECKVLIKYPL